MLKFRIPCLTRFVLALFLIGISLHGAAQSTIFVNSSALGNDDGSSWSDAFTDLQDGLAASLPGDSLWVAAGTYKPVVAVDPGAVTDSERRTSFQLQAGVTVYGGFTGGESELTERDWVANPTILSGDIGITDDADDNSFHVVSGSSADNASLLDGFVVTGGNANGTSADGLGGGIYINASSPTIANVAVVGNLAIIGGGILANQSALSLTGVILSQNSASNSGGGMALLSSSPMLVNCALQGNASGGNGGGLFISTGTGASLANVLFSGNAAVNGGAVFNETSSPTLVNATFSGNLASGKGGGMYNRQDSYPLVRNSLFWNNRAEGVTGSASASVFNVPDDPDFPFDAPSIPEFSNALVQGCKPGGSWLTDCGIDVADNLPDDDPLFVASVDPVVAPTELGNLQLQADSPAIDAGNDAFLPAGIDLDLNGGPRVLGSAVDLGPYERLADLIFQSRFE